MNNKTKETFENQLNKSDHILDYIYYLSQHQLLQFEIAKSHDQDLALISEVESHVQAYNHILEIIDQTRG